MPRRAANPNELQSACYHAEDMAAHPPVPNEPYFEAILTIGTVATAEFGADPRQTNKLARTVTRHLTKAIDVEVEPPFTESQLAVLIKQHEVFTKLSEVTAPEVTQRKQRRATDTKRIQTNAAKS